MDINELKQIIQNAGVCGAGGAGFPTYAKLDKRVNTIILNCAECEPLLKVHRQLLEKYAYEIVSALVTIAKAVEAKEIILAIKNSYQKTVEAVNACLDGSNLEIPIRIGILPEVYPAGDEVITIYETTKKVVPPGKIPLDIGIAVFNVETIWNVYNATHQIGAVTHKYLTIAGEVNNPVTLKVPIGITVNEVVSAAGGATVEDPVYINGGPMTGRIVLGTEVINKTFNAILVMPKHHFIVQKKMGNVSTGMKRAMSSCCQCRMCTDLCPRYLLGHPIEPHAFMRSATTGVTKDLSPFLDTFFCSQCGLCEMYACDQGLLPRTLIGSCKDGLRNNKVPVPKDVPLAPVNSTREYRMVPMKRLTARLGLTNYNLAAPLMEHTIDTNLVKIALSQHIGAPAIPVVQQNDIVIKGQIIGQAQEGKLSLPCHASIDGMVWDINEKYVTIKKK